MNKSAYVVAIAAPVPKRGFSVEDAATYTALGVYKIRKLIRDNRLIARRHGKDVIILKEDLDVLLEGLEIV